uniref:Luciferase-like domain-containing protein n=1 Tax=Curvibacter symbiont subsp. Hydra magnipapillata TaxID=667019 RepID=C9YC39_CURXX|nr:hypothetical protein Csp_C22680 [Curvibacter putative symbiont of Hydra magnipapillata]
MELPPTGVNRIRDNLPMPTHHLPRLSMLDLVAVREGGTVGQALQIALRTAQHAEALGFERYWLAEHHNMPGIASSATAVLVGHIAGGTDRIRVGSGGIMLPTMRRWSWLKRLAPWRSCTRVASTSAWAGPPVQTKPPCAPCAATKSNTKTISRATWPSCKRFWRPCNRGKGWSPCPVRARRYPSGCWAPACIRPNWPATWGCLMRSHPTSHHAICTRRLRCTAACSNRQPHWPNHM